MSHADKAVEYFSHNFNCSQGVFTAFAVENDIDEKLALKLGTCLGGGGRKGEMCGAVSGALMALGLLYGHSEENDSAAKAKAYAMTVEFMDRFSQRNGSVVCRELLGYDLSKPEEMAIIKEKKLFQTKCTERIRSAAEILDELLKEYKK